MAGISRPDVPFTVVGRGPDRVGSVFPAIGVLLVASSIVASGGTVALGAASSVASSSQDQRTQRDLLQQIQTEATSNSQLMETASWLADVFGPRLANSPSYDAAAEWARGRLVDFGVEASVEPYGEFGVTWRNEYTSVHMLRPRGGPRIPTNRTTSTLLDGIGFGRFSRTLSL